MSDPNFTTPPKKTRQKPEVISFGSRQQISTQLFNTPLVADKMITDAVNEWFAISDIAKFVYGKSFQANNRRVRQNIWALRRELVQRGFFLISEGRPVEHVKICTNSPMETQIARAILGKMRTRSDISAVLYEKAAGLVNEGAAIREAS